MCISTFKEVTLSILSTELQLQQINTEVFVVTGIKSIFKIDFLKKNQIKQIK
jgi:hypothetical protein